MKKLFKEAVDMKRPIVKIGDRVILSSPRYDIHECEAIIVATRTNGTAATFRPLNVKFDHSNFRSNGYHSIERGDVYWKKVDQFTEGIEDLFYV